MQTGRLGGMLALLILAGCAPRIDRIEVYSGARGARSAPPPIVREGSPLTVRTEVTPFETALGEPTYALQQIAPAPETVPGPTASLAPAGDVSGPGSPPAQGKAFEATQAPTTPPRFTYGSLWKLDLVVPYGTAGAMKSLRGSRNFAVGAPANCTGFDQDLEEASIVGNRFRFGRSFQDHHAWPMDESQHATHVALVLDPAENYPQRFQGTPELPFASASFTIGGDHPENFERFLVNNVYTRNQNQWLVTVRLPRFTSTDVSLRLKTEAEDPLKIRARALCALSGPAGLLAPCMGDAAYSWERTVAPGGWREVAFTIDTSSFPASSVMSGLDLEILGEAGDVRRRVWIDFVCAQ